jgi:hypothetical protein
MTLTQRRLRFHSVLIMVAAALVVADEARGQDLPLVEVATQYGWMRDPEPANVSLRWIDEPSTFEGWRTEVAYAITRDVAIVGDISGYYKTYHPRLFTLEVNLRNYGFLGGPRFSFRRVPHTVLFGQVLLGWARAAYGIGGQPGTGSSITDHAIQPVGGAQLWLVPRIGIQAEAGYRRIFFNARTRSNERTAAVGLVVGAF